MTSALRATHPVRLDLGDVERLPLTAGSGEHVAMLLAVIDVLGDNHHGLPRQVRREIEAVADERVRAAFRPVTGRRTLLPEALMAGDEPVESVEDYLQRMRSLDRAALPAELAAMYGADLPERWRGPAARPQAWYRAVADCVEAVWNRVPLWRRGRPLVEREVERLGAALVTGAVEGVFSRLGPKLRYRDGGVYSTGPARADFSLAGGRRLRLVPMVAGPRALLVNDDHPDVHTFWYPAPGVRTLLEPAPAPPADADPLTAVLGPQRAAVLRCLDRPATMGTLAAAVGAAQNTLTYHCDQLACAGLIARERRGKSVRVTRTDRGSALMDALAR